MRPLAISSLLLASLSLGACATAWKPPEISYDNTPKPAVLQADPPKPVQIVELPKPLPLPGQLKPLPGNRPLVEAIQKHGRALFGQEVPAMGTPLYTDVRLYGEAGVPGVIYGAGPRTVLESHAKRADERLELEDLRRATKVVARTLRDLLGGSA